MSLCASSFPQVGGKSGAVLWYRQPAEEWTEALPIGNGRLGAMVFGGAVQDRLQLNIDSLWAGPPFPELLPTAKDALFEARRLFAEDKRAEAERAIAERFLPQEGPPRSYQTLGDLWITTRIPRDTPLEDFSTIRWRRGPVSKALMPEQMEPEFDDKEWSVVRMDREQERSVPENSTVVFRGRFTLTKEQAAAYNRLSFSPIDDSSVVWVNGVEVLVTNAYDRPHRVSVAGRLKVGRNDIAVAVTNYGGPGHMAADAVLTSAFVPNKYERSLSLMDGLSNSAFLLGKTRHHRTSFASAVDGVIVYRMESSAKGSLVFDVKLDRPRDFSVRPSGSRRLVLTGQAGHIGKNLGVKFACVIHVQTEGGTVKTVGDRIEVSGADGATILVAAETDYNMSSPFSPLTKDLNVECQRRLDDVSKKSYKQLIEANVADHRSYMGRCTLTLGGGKTDLPTDERLRLVRSGDTDPGLAALYFTYGRYLLESCSRPGTLPANLQGLWNSHMEAPWNADYHTNINVQMNYWPAEVTNLSDAHDPLFWLIDGLVPSGQKFAQSLGMRGFAFGHTTDVWLWATPQGMPVWGMWPMGAGWCSAHFMERYRFTQDKEFLRARAWPVLKEAALFYLDWLVKDPKTNTLTSGPTTSPENTYVKNGQRLSLSMGTAMDREIIWETFTNVLEAADVLGEGGEFVQEVRDALARLARIKIGKDGRILEWSEELEEAEPGHRHMSHLYGLHPSSQFTWSKTPDLFRAARKSLEFRLANGGGHTGWSRAWMINFWARLFEPEKAGENVDALLAKSTLPNMFDNHPPFQIDGNFGGTAGIAEMLMQSHEGFVRIMPAIPKAWASGEVTGLRARGGHEASFKWSKGNIQWLRLKRFAGEGQVGVLPPSGPRLLFVTIDSRSVETTKKNGVTWFNLPMGKTATFVFAPN